MRNTLLVAVLTALTLSVADVASASAGAAAPKRWTHTRPLTPGATALLAVAVRRSPIVEALVMGLERTDVVVYLTDSMSGVKYEPASYLQLLSYAAGTRYLLVRIDRWRTLIPEQIALLGHELQHALEVAAAPEVIDTAGMARLYQQIGWEGRTGRFESDGARQVGRRVRNQLAGIGQ